jgi:hypothetical protein
MEIIKKAIEFYQTNSHSSPQLFKFFKHDDLVIVPIHLETCQFIIIDNKTDTYRYLSQSEIKYELRKQQQLALIRSSLRQSNLDNIIEVDERQSDTESNSSFESFVSDSPILESVLYESHNS